MTNTVHLLPGCCNDYELDAWQSTAPPLTRFGDGWSVSFKDHKNPLDSSNTQTQGLRCYFGLNIAFNTFQSEGT